jgi:hypothetical protein
MSIFEDTNPRELKELLRQIEDREAVLPDFQRDFVWDASATQELICSIASNFPAGSLLRIRNTNNLFACREFQGAPELGGQHPTYLVLDGQQRLTSLYQAFYGKGDYRYYLNLKKIIEGADFEECVFFRRANHRDAKRLEGEDAQADELVLPLSVLRDGAGHFGRWMLRVARRQTDLAQRAALEDRLSNVEEKWIRAIEFYKFPVVTLSDTVNADAVCTIFETLNRTGVKLSVFELLTARFWPQKINLRRLWDQAKADFPIIADFNTDAYYVLQAISLLCRPTPSCKRGDVLDLATQNINEWWDRAVKALAESLEILRDDCGVIVSGWLPYNTIIMPMVAVLAKHQDAEAHGVGASRKKLARWFWCCVFSQAYENAPNSQAAKDFGELTKWLGGGEPPTAVAEFKFDAQSLRDTTVRQRAVYRGLICLILRRQPRDFYNNARITGDLMVEHHIDDHHIFPNAYLGRTDIPQKLRDCILNRTLIDRSTNIRISDRAPSDYLSDVKDALGAKEFGVLLESHLLPTGADSPLLGDDFDAFLKWRQDALWREIVAVSSPTDPLGPDDENDILTACALRFDGNKYGKEVGLNQDAVIEHFFTTKQWPEGREEQLALFYMLQRFLLHWAGVDLPKESCYWRAFRELYLMVNEYSIPPQYVLGEYEIDWLMKYEPRRAECTQIIRDIHQATIYEDAASAGL